MEQHTASASVSDASSSAAGAPASPRFPGASIQLGGREYVVPALSLRSLRDLRPEMKRIAEGATDDPLEYLSDVSVVVHAAIARNYPDVQLDELLELIDMANVGMLLKAASGNTITAAARLPIAPAE